MVTCAPATVSNLATLAPADPANGPHRVLSQSQRSLADQTREKDSEEAHIYMVTMMPDGLQLLRGTGLERKFKHLKQSKVVTLLSAPVLPRALPSLVCEVRKAFDHTS